MKSIVLLTLGSRGDVQPYVALGQRLRQAGHIVTLATHQSFADFVRAHGLDFAPLAGDPQEILRTQAAQNWLKSGVNVAGFGRHLLEIAGPLIEQTLSDSLAACRGADLIIGSSLGVLVGYHVAEKLRRPLLPAYLQPIHSNSWYPAPASPLWPLGGAYNRLTYLFFIQGLWLVSRSMVNRARRVVLGLPPISWRGPDILERRDPAVYAISPLVMPRPPEWGAHLHLDGYWFLDRPVDWQPPAELVRFLEAGPPPVSIGFGSMVGGDPAALARLALAALERAGQRGVLLGGWGGLGEVDLPPSVFKIDAIPHDWLFPRLAAVVHHGGAGTTAAGLRAGVPAVVTPLFADQPFWADRVARLGVGPRPIPHARLTAERLAAAIQVAVNDPAMRARAARLGERIRAEDGLGRTAEVVHSLLGRG